MKAEAMADYNQCPAPGCNHRKPRTRAFCIMHWRRLPKGIRDRIWAAFGGGTMLMADWLKAMKEAQQFLGEAEK